jgi:LPS sulfotransferase NodH
LTVLAVAAVESPLLRRVSRTNVGREVRANRVIDRAVRALKDKHKSEAVSRDLFALYLGAHRGAGSTASIPRGTTQHTASAANVTRFVILGEGRSGSSLLRTELDRRWSEIRCLGEPYDPTVRLRSKRPGESTEEITARVFAATESRPIVGCKLFFFHVSRAELSSILALPGMKVVRLRRRNVLRQYVSLQIAFNSGIWARNRRHASPAVDERAVTVDIERFIRYVYNLLENQRAAERALADAGVDALDVWYEDLSEHLDVELRRIATFLGAGKPAHEAEPVLARQNPEPLRLLVRNYAEVRSRLSHTSMRVFLDPEDGSSRAGSSGWRRESQTCWPTEQQELLLRAALLPPDQACDAFVEWRNVTDPYHLDEGSRRLFPLVHRNLRRAGVTTSLDPMMWSAWVEASGRNQMLFRVLEQVLAALDDVGVPTLVLKGAALTALHYRDRGARPMADLDVMVPREFVARAIEVLRAENWAVERPWHDRPVDQLMRMKHAVSLLRGDDTLDLHWHALALSIGTGLEAELWDASVAMDVEGQRTRALGPADQLLHAFVHGLRYNPVPPFRWIADAHVVITSSRGSLAWDQLLRRADRYRLAAWVSAAVGYLDRLFPSLVPPPVIAAARSMPITRQERRAFEHFTHGSFWILDTWRRYRWREDNRGLLLAAPGFAEELRVLYDLDSVWRLPERGVRGIQQRWSRDRNRDAR